MITDLNSKLDHLKADLQATDSPVLRQQIQENIDQTLANLEELEDQIPWKPKKPKPPVEAVSGFMDESVETKTCDGDGAEVQSNSTDASGNREELEAELDDVM